MKSLRLVAILLLGSCALGQQAPAIFEGSWIASAGQKDIFRGRWSGQALLRTRNAAHGSWLLLNDKKQTVLQGTWSAQKSAAGWQGTWSARTLQGQSVAGTWTANLADFKGKTFEDMLQRAAEKQIAGFWRSARMQGYWWLQNLR